MGVKSDKWFRERCTGGAPMIEPYVPNLVREVAGRKVISYGQSSYGYDIRCGNEFKVFTNVNCAEVDPKGLKETAFTTFTREDGEYILIPPNSFVLASSVEYFRIPRDVIGVCFGKSTMARAGLIVPITPLEPGWEGHLTIEVSNTTRSPRVSTLVRVSRNSSSSGRTSSSAPRTLTTLPPACVAARSRGLSSCCARRARRATRTAAGSTRDSAASPCRRRDHDN